MLKYFGLVFVVVFFCSCGVDTSSSGNIAPVVVGTNVDLIDPNPINSDGGGDANETPPGNGNPTPDNPGGQPADAISDFDKVDAIYDANACNPATYKLASDASYNGINLGENGSNFFSIKDQGLEIRSEHLEGDPTNSYKTWVTLFYKSFPDSKYLGLQGYTSYLMQGVFYLTYDIAWSDQSIGGIDRTMYMQTTKDTTLEKDAKLTCYRLSLNSVIGTQIDVRKVYRNR